MNPISTINVIWPIADPSLLGLNIERTEDYMEELKEFFDIGKEIEISNIINRTPGSIISRLKLSLILILFGGRTQKTSWLWVMLPGANIPAAYTV